MFSRGTCLQIHPPPIPVYAQRSGAIRKTAAVPAAAAATLCVCCLLPFLSHGFGGCEYGRRFFLVFGVVRMPLSVRYVRVARPGALVAWATHGTVRQYCHRRAIPDASSGAGFFFTFDSVGLCRPTKPHIKSRSVSRSAR